MNYDFLSDFELHEKVSHECIDKYAEKIPGALIDIWKNYGFGSFMNGYLRIINPDEYIGLLGRSYFRADIAVPIMTTAFGDIIIWENQHFIVMVNYRYGRRDTMIRGLVLFAMLLKDKTFQKRFFSLEAYEEAVQKYGKVAFDECFGYVPLLAMGGKECVENIKIVKLREHIAVIADMTGGV